jgi:prevent-host-death family protein
MSEEVDICDAKTRLAVLVDRAEAGEEIIIARGGRPVTI